MSADQDKQQLLDLFNAARIKAEQGIASVNNGDFEKAKTRAAQLADIFLQVNDKLGIVKEVTELQAVAVATQDDLAK